MRGTGLYGLMGLNNLGALTAAHIAYRDKVAANIEKSGSCEGYSTWADTWTRLSQKDKDAQTLAAAKELAADFSQRYINCTAQKATAAVAAAGTIGTASSASTLVPIKQADGTTALVAMPTGGVQVTPGTDYTKILVIGGVGLVALLGAAWFFMRKRGRR